MAETVPTCAKVTLSGTTNADLIDGWHDWIVANGAGEGWSVANVVGSPVTSFTAEHSGGGQINYRLTGGEILGMVSPSGGISDSAAPGTPSGAQPEEVFFPAMAGNSDEALFWLQGNSVAIIVKDTGKTYCKYMDYRGKNITTTNIKANGPTGWGSFGYIPTQTAAFTAGSWFTTNSTAVNRKSWIQITDTDWANPTIIRSISSISSAGDGTRFSQESVVAGSSGDTPAGSSDPARGVLKHIFADTVASGLPFSVVPDATVDQAMLRINDSAAATRMCLVWDKFVTP